MEDELLGEFLNESREHLATIEADLLAIEERGADLDEDLVNKVFRAAHSIKGGSSFFGLNKVRELAHMAETVLDMLRSRKIIPNAEVTNVLLAAFDKLREIINQPGESEQTDTSDLVSALSALAASYLPTEQKAALKQRASLKAAKGGRVFGVPQIDLERAKRLGQSVYCVDYDLIHDIERKGRKLLQVFHELTECGEILDCAIDFEAIGTLDGPPGNQLPVRVVLATTLASHLMPELLGVLEKQIELLFDPFSSPTIVTGPEPASELPTEPMSIPESESLRPEAVLAMPDPQPAPVSSRPASAEGSSAAPQNSADESLRINVGLLESLMNLAGELVLSRNQLRSAIAQNDVQSLHVADQRLNQVTSDLQDAIMRTRLQPIGNVFAKFPRVVRDMANALHKEINLEVRGKDVALDRTLIEGLSDPLTHMVRNAVDHGIEFPEERRRGGKRGEGTITIDARHEAGQVIVEISDDGKGIQPGKVADSAVAKGLITADKAKALSDQEKVNLIFLPGLSTAEKVTDISGRGVGMDVVKTNLDRLGGQVEIKTEAGKGSVFRIKLPLTLAIIPSLIVSVGSERFALPQINVVELLHVPAENVAKRIERIGGAKVLRLRDRLLPFIRLNEVLSNPARTSLATALDGKGALNIAVVSTGSLQYAVAVSTFLDTEEIVVKPLGRHLKELREYAGATILGDGAVALILDPAGLALKAQLGLAQARASRVEEGDQGEAERLKDTHAMLLFHNASDEVCAAPLDTVLRIERVKPEQIESMGSRRTLQYRGASLPLVTLADAAQVKSIGNARDLAVIVSSVRGREVGLLGAMPVDVVESTEPIDQTTHRQKGISGSAIIRGHTTLIVDIFELVDSLYPDWNDPSGLARGRSASAATENPVVLLAEDSDFFRAQVTKYLEKDGFKVLAGADGEAAWDLLQENADSVTAVVTDIEMPRLTGLGLAQRIRSDERFGQLPIIALTSLAGEDDMAKGKAAGINEYQIKLDRDRLIAGVRAAITVT